MRRFIILLLVICFSGCAGLGYREGDVKVTISGLQLLDATLLEQRYLFKLRLLNRSQRALSISGLSFDVELNGKEFASGVSNQQVSLSAFDEAMVEVKVSSSLFGIIRQLQSMQEMENKALDYKISGRVYLAAGVFSLPFEETGMIDLNLPPSGRGNGI